MKRFNYNKKYWCATTGEWFKAINRTDNILYIQKCFTKEDLIKVKIKPSTQYNSEYFVAQGNVVFAY